MNEIIALIGSVLGSIVLALTISSYVFYTKTDVDQKITELQNISDKRDLENERNINELKLMINNRNSELQESLRLNVQEFFNHLNDLKRDENNNSVKFLEALNDIKEELRKDYTSRYNELMLLINQKANLSDFTRLETKFDELSSVIIELKTVVQMKLDDKK